MMSQSMHITQPCRFALSVINMALLYIRLMPGDQRTRASQSMRPIEYVPLLSSYNGYCSFPSTLGPCSLENETISTVSIAGSKLDGLLAAQPESLLQEQAHVNVGIIYFIQTVA